MVRAQVEARVFFQGRNNVPDNSGISAIHGGQMLKVAPMDGFTAPSRKPTLGPEAEQFNLCGSLGVR